MEAHLDPVSRVISKIVDFVKKYKNLVLGGLVAIVLFTSASIGYRWYFNSVQVAAHRDFVQALKYFDAPVKEVVEVSAAQEHVFPSEQTKWAKVIQVFQDAYKKNSHSTLAPLFQAFLSEAYLNSGNYAQALQELQVAVSNMKGDSVKQAYILKLALMSLDSPEPKVVEAGLEQLKRIAYEPENIAHAQALFHLGMYSWVHKNFDQAKGLWQQFIVKFGEEKTLEREVKIVRSKLELIAV
ncbi:MAG: tetratricopeptide repeat protein [bacterium]